LQKACVGRAASLAFGHFLDSSGGKLDSVHA
jgi:hypothetical protein